MFDASAVIALFLLVALIAALINGSAQTRNAYKRGYREGMRKGVEREHLALIDIFTEISKTKESTRA